MRQWLADFRQDCRHALRLMRRTPQVSILMVLSLAIGIGANVTLVAATTHALLRPPPHIREPERVVRLLRVADDGQSSSSAIAAANYPRLLDIQRQATAFEGVAAHATRTMSIGRGANAMEVRASLVSAGFFSVLGVKAQLGRAFSEADGYPNSGQNGGAPLAVVSHTFWKRHLAGDVAAYGRSIRIGEILYTIVGVAPPGFRGVDAEEPDVWLPITVAAADPAAALSLDDRSRYSVAIVARLRSSVTRSLAEQQATAIWKQGDFAMNSSQAPVRIVAATLLRGRAPDAPREVRVMFWLVGVSALVLLITCANVANILLSRAVARRQETAVRLALGASPQRLARQMLAEGIILASAGAMAAVVVAIVSVPLLSTFVFGDVVDGGVVPTIALSAAIAGLGTAALISLAPAAQSLRYTQLADLRSAKPTWGHRGSHVRTALLIGQSAICMAMLIIAGLFALSLRRATSLDLGLDVDRTIRALVKLDGLMVPKEVVEATYAEMLRRVQAIPGVEGVALASSDPFAGGRAVAAHTLERDAEFFWPPSTTQIAIEAAVGEGFFRAVGARSLRGRDFEAGDNRSAPRVAIINSPLARILFPGKEALGECILLPKRSDDRGASCVTVVGVLGGVWYASIASVRPETLTAQF